MFGIKLLAIFLAAGVIAYIMTPVAIWLAQKIGAVDMPNQRKVHTHAMPRIGGIAIFAGVMLPGLFEAGYVLKGQYLPFWGILAGGTIIFAVGLLDDLVELSAWKKLAGQSLGACVAITCGLRVHFITGISSDHLYVLGVLSIPVTFLWLVGVTNAINLIDGLDGLAAGVSGIAALSLGIVAYTQGQPALLVLMVVIGGAILGFLPYNFHPAQTFMGDCGSNFLGFLMGATAILGMAKMTAIVSLLVPVLILGVPILDTLFAILRRMHNGVGIFSPDKNHLHHRLLKMGFSHAHTVLIIYGVSAVFGASAIVMRWVSRPQAAAILLVLLVLVGIGVWKTGVITAGSAAVEQLDARRAKEQEAERLHRAHKSA